MKKSAIFLSIMLIAACNKSDLIPVAYINEAEGSSFTPSEVSAIGADVTVNFSTNYAWQVKGYTKLTFCSLSAIRGEAGNASIVVKVEPNANGVVRTESFDIVAGAARKTVTISQTETNTVVIDTKEYTVPAAGGTVEIVVSSNVDYVVNIPEDVTWVKVLPKSKVVTDTYVNLSVDPQKEWSSRSASVTVVGKDIEGADITIPVVINQESPVKAIWSKTFAADLTQISVKAPFHVAMYNGELLMATADGIHAIDPATGAYKSEFNVSGLSVAPESMANDEAGNLLFAKNAECASEDFVIYAYDGKAVSELLRYKAGTLYTGKLGNVRVVGDIKDKAVVTAVASSVNYFVAWQIEGGQVTETVAKPIAGTGIGDVIYGCASPVSDNLSDGVLFIGYSGDPYSLYYNGDPANATNDNWTALYNTGTAGNENYCSISVAEMNGKKYCAIGQDGHFSWSVAPKLMILDITDLDNTTLVYENSFAGTFGIAGANDVKLAVDGDNLHAYVISPGFDFANCLELISE